ncbi:hypothetical protein HGRIS_012073 [Hohenbuehelia grisea]|uniref:BZIP domain-containing protein n=1 Tax=Hohenbuehelia grisea TaxID=104357 RepID=A0ABR3IR66_9AGAR
MQASTSGVLSTPIDFEYLLLRELERSQTSGYDEGSDDELEPAPHSSSDCSIAGCPVHDEADLTDFDHEPLSDSHGSPSSQCISEDCPLRDTSPLTDLDESNDESKPHVNSTTPSATQSDHTKQRKSRRRKQRKQKKPIPLTGVSPKKRRHNNNEKKKAYKKDLRLRKRQAKQAARASVLKAVVDVRRARATVEELEQWERDREQRWFDGLDMLEKYN